MDVGFSNVIESTRQYFQRVPAGGAVTPRQPAAASPWPHYPPVSSAPSPLPYPTSNITSNRLPSIGTLSGHRSGKGSPMEVLGRTYSKYAGDQPALYHPSAVTSPPAGLQPSPNLLLSAHLPSHLQNHQASVNHLQTPIHSSALLQNSHNNLLQSSHHPSSNLLLSSHHTSSHLQTSHQNAHHPSSLLQNSLHTSHNSSSNLLQSSHSSSNLLQASLNASSNLLQASHNTHNTSSNHLSAALHASANHLPSAIHATSNHQHASHHSSNLHAASHLTSSSQTQSSHHSSNHSQHNSLIHHQSNHPQASHYPNPFQTHHSSAAQLLQAHHAKSTPHIATSHHSSIQHLQHATHHTSSSSSHQQSTQHSSSSHHQSSHHSSTAHHPPSHHQSSNHVQTIHHLSSSSTAHLQASHHPSLPSSIIQNSHHLNSSLLHPSHASASPMMQSNHTQPNMNAGLLQPALLSGHAQSLYPPGSMYYKSSSSNNLNNLNTKIHSGHLTAAGHHQVPNLPRPPSQPHLYAKSPGPSSSVAPRQSPLPQYVHHQSRSSSTQSSYTSQAAVAAQTIQDSRRGKRESPLDLSVKTVRQSADSTAPEPHVPRADLTGSFSAALRRLPPIMSFSQQPIPRPDPPPAPSVDNSARSPQKRMRIGDTWRQSIDRQIDQKLSSYLSSRNEVRDPPAGQKVLNLLRTSLETRRPRPPPVVDLSNDDDTTPAPPAELDGLAAFLAARIRTKAELKQVDSEKQQLLQQASSTPKHNYLPQPLASSTPQAAFKPDESVSSIKPLDRQPITPVRTQGDASSVFDFRDSDDELPGPRRQPVIHPVPPPQLHSSSANPPSATHTPIKEERIEPEVKGPLTEEDKEWSKVCEELTAQLARVVDNGRSVPRRKPRPPMRALHPQRRRIKKEKDSKDEKEDSPPVEELVEVPWLRKSYLAKDVAEGPPPEFPQGWQDEMYRFKQSLRMPDCLISVPRPTSYSSLPDLQRYHDASAAPSPTSAPVAKSDKSYLDQLMDRFCSQSAMNSTKSTGRSQSSPRPKPSDENPFLGYLTTRPPVQKHSIKEVFGEERASSAPPTPRAQRQKSRPRPVLRSIFLRTDPLRRKAEITRKRKRPRLPSAPGDPSRPKKLKKKKQKIKKVPKTDTEIQAEMKTWVLNKNAGETVLQRLICRHPITHHFHLLLFRTRTI